jgi:hypothetical protein
MLEIVVEMAHTQLIYLVLHYYNGKVFGHDFVFRQMGSLKTDGTFSNSFGGTQGIARLKFTEGAYEYIFVYRDDEEISEDMLSLWLDYQNAKEDVVWHEFIDFIYKFT